MTWGTDIELGIIDRKLLRITDFPNQFNQNRRSFKHIIITKVKHILQAPFDQTKMFKHLTFSLKSKFLHVQQLRTRQLK